MIEFDAITTLCLACVLYLIGQTIINHVSILRRICIPAPVIGGLLFAILVAILDSFNIVKIKLDSAFIQNFFMLAFFTTIGLGASLKLFKIGGKVMLIYFTFCGIMAICQNIIGVSLAKLLNIKPLLGLTAGSMSMEGGHGNAADFIGWDIVDLKMSEQIGDISLGIFLSLALMSIQLTQIYSLAIPLIIIVLVQVVFMVLFSIFILFKGLGKDYDAAVMVGGFIGHGLGATPNAMANLDVITKKFGNSPKAYLVVPIVGAFLIDLIGVIIVMTFIQLFS